jgi:uncharacterized protein YdaU (DUF1376 family)
MKHYPHHIGDFDKATRHLTRIERSVYRDLIDLYYDTEQRLPLEKSALCRKIIACSSEESTAVEQVLNEFFTETPTGWYHSRCEEEIEAYHANTSQKAMAGKASAEAKRLKKLQALNESTTHVERPLKSVGTSEQRNPTNQSTNQPINHQPVEGRASPNGSRLPADWSLPDDWALWAKETRPELNPNETAQRFADYWHGVAGGKGRKADWLATWRNWVRSEKAPPPQRVQPVSFAQQAADIARTTVPSRIDRDPALVQLEDDFKKAVPMPESVRQALGSLTRKMASNDVREG